MLADAGRAMAPTLIDRDLIDPHTYTYTPLTVIANVALGLACGLVLVQAVVILYVWFVVRGSRRLALTQRAGAAFAAFGANFANFQTAASCGAFTSAWMVTKARSTPTTVV